MIVVSLRESLLNIVYIMCALSCKRISLYVVSTKCLSYSVLKTIQTGTSRSTRSALYHWAFQMDSIYM